MNHNYLAQQFADPALILEGIRQVVKRGDFTLGSEVQTFEQAFAKMCGTAHAIGVANGTDALFLSLKALGLEGYEVITTPYSFFATTAAIVNAGATPVFVDVGRDFLIDPANIEAAITPKTGAILPVHWAGRPCNMHTIMGIAMRHDLKIIEDCAHAPNTFYHGKKCGSFGQANAFSLHPLKNVNVWGDGGVVTTDSDQYAATVRQLRNHGMSDRNTIQRWGYNSRLDTVQAVVGLHVLARIENITACRRANAANLDRMLKDVEQIELPANAYHSEPNYYLYTFHAEDRDGLRDYLIENGVDAKVHYPIPLHLQPAAKDLGYKAGDFPVAEWCAETTLSIPCHDYLTYQELEQMANLIRNFYR